MAKVPIYIYVLLILLVLVLSVCIYTMVHYGDYIVSRDGIRPPDIEESFTLDWACMDGCYNMLLVQGSVDYYNITQEKLHSKCTNMCHDQYLIEEVVIYG